MSKSDIQLLGADLHQGDTVYRDCPWCGRLNKAGITRTNEGLLYNCFSSGCGAKGFIPDIPDYNRKTRTIKPRFRRWIGRPEPVSDADCRYFRERFNVSLMNWPIYVTLSDEYLFPIRDFDDVRVGEVLRQPSWEGCHREGRADLPKALTYLDDGAPRLSWHKGYHTRALVLVEDQVSAEVVRQSTQLTSVALLGNTLGTKELAELRRAEPEVLIIWLDPDMSAQAFKMNAEIGQNFPVSRVVFTDRDPKDLTRDEVRAALYD